MKLELNQKTVGALLVIFSFILLFILVGVKINVDKEQSFLCKFVENSQDLGMDECPAHDSNISWLLLVGFAIGFLVLVSGFYLFFAPVKEKEVSTSGPTKRSSPASLTEEEKKMYDLILLKEGSMYQSELIKETGWSKVKVSRILDRMEGKGIIDRKRRGMTNIVILK